MFRRRMGNENKKAASRKTGGPAPRSGGAGGSGGNAVMNATQKMKLTIDNLSKRRTLLELRAQQARKQAFEYKKKNNKAQALMALKRSKLFEDQVSKVDSQLFNLERQQINLEAGSTTLEVVNAVSTGLRAQRHLAANMNPDQVAEQVDQQQELIENQEEVQEILAQDTYDAVNNDELLAELEQMEADDVEDSAFKTAVETRGAEIETLPAVPNQPILPQVPTGPVKAPIGSDEEALEALQAEML